MIRQAWLTTSSFCKASVLERCLEFIYKDGRPDILQHIIIDNHYPINKAANRDRIRCLANEYGCLYIDSGRDLGLHDGVNNAMKQLATEKDHIWIGCDPDDSLDAKSIQAIREVMTYDRSIAVAALSFSVINERFQQGKLREETIAGHKVWAHPDVEMFNISGMDMGFLKEVGGFHQHFKYYGGLEAALYPEWAKRKMRLVYLADVKSDSVHIDRFDRILFDPEYRDYKTAHVNRQFDGSFEEYLISVGKKELIG